jgi:hypothetical protein
VARANALQVKTSQGADADAAVLLAITFLLPVRSRVHRTESRSDQAPQCFPAETANLASAEGLVCGDSDAWANGFMPTTVRVKAQAAKGYRISSWVAACKSEPPRWCVRCQIDRFLPLCPITSRDNVIPAGYDQWLRADSSHEILVDQADRRMHSLLTRRDLRNTRSADQSARKSLGTADPMCPGLLYAHRGCSPSH